MLRGVDPPCDLSEALLALIAAGDTNDVSERIVEYAPRVCVGWSLAGLFVVANEMVVTAACTDGVVADLDQVQFELDEGPCLDAVSERLTYQARDLKFDMQWPRFGIAAQRAGVRSVLAIPLATEEIRALALYGYAPASVEDDRLARAATFAAVAAIALDCASYAPRLAAHRP